jgi:homoserine dehydrogenase
MFQIRLQVFSCLHRKVRLTVDIALLGNGIVGNGLLKHIETQNKNDSALFTVRYILLKPDEICPDPTFTNMMETILEDTQIKIVVEAMGGQHPAFEYLKAAIEHKKHIVTSNKELVSVYGEELARLAHENHVAFFFSAAVGGGIPLLVYLRDTAKQETIQEISGILNGTTNFILDAMTRRHLDFNEALKQAQKLGYAESDPTNDVQGFDLAFKLRIASCVAFGQWIDKESIFRLPLHTISSTDIEFFARRDMTLRYLVNAGIGEDGKLFATIQPTAVANHHIEAQVLRNNNLFLCRSERSGEQILIGQGAGASPTAANVYRDLLRIHNDEVELISGNETNTQAENSGCMMRYYIRTTQRAAENFPVREIMETDTIHGNVILITHRVSVNTFAYLINELRTFDSNIFVCAIQATKEGE